MILFYIYFYKLYQNYQIKHKEQINKDLNLLKSDTIYNKIKFIKPQQISISGKLDLETIQQNIIKLKDDYTKLISTNNNDKLLEDIKIKEQENQNLVVENDRIQRILYDKNKILDQLVPNSRNNFSDFIFGAYNLNI